MYRLKYTKRWLNCCKSRGALPHSWRGQWNQLYFWIGYIVCGCWISEWGRTRRNVRHGYPHPTGCKVWGWRTQSENCEKLTKGQQWDLNGQNPKAKMPRAGKVSPHQLGCGEHCKCKLPNGDVYFFRKRSYLGRSNGQSVLIHICRKSSKYHIHRFQYDNNMLPDLPTNCRQLPTVGVYFTLDIPHADSRRVTTLVINTSGILIGCPVQAVLLCWWSKQWLNVTFCSSFFYNSFALWCDLINMAKMVH